MGAARTVTGSKYLLEHEGKRVLVDCGLFQGLKELRVRNWEPFPIPPREIDAVVLTHAHLDHVGYLPRLRADGYRGRIFCTAGTKELCSLVLPDSGRIQEEDARQANRHGYSKHQPALPLYTEEDAETALGLLQVVKNDGQPFEIAKGISAEFRIAGHILGSSQVLVLVETDQGVRRILFSGDLGKYDQPIIRDPVAPPACEYLVVESTYGDRTHDPEEPKIALERIIKNAAEHDSEILIPAFAVGRAQEVLYLIRELEDEKRVPILPVILDSPMASKATKVYANRREEHDEEYVTASAGNANPLQTHSMTTSTSREDSKRLNQQRGARVIISASGMMSGGRVLHHALRVLPNANATVVFVGYQAGGTLGRRVADGEKEVRVLGQWVPVRCQSVKIGGFSAHADWQEVIRWLQDLPSPPRRVFITHGEVGSATAMAEHIRQRFGWQIEVPEHGEQFELS